MTKLISALMFVLGPGWGIAAASENGVESAEVPSDTIEEPHTVHTASSEAFADEADIVPTAPSEELQDALYDAVDPVYCRGDMDCRGLGAICYKERCTTAPSEYWGIETDTRLHSSISRLKSRAVLGVSLFALGAALGYGVLVAQTVGVAGNVDTVYYAGPYFSIPFLVVKLSGLLLASTSAAMAAARREGRYHYVMLIAGAVVTASVGISVLVFHRQDEETSLPVLIGLQAAGAVVSDGLFIGQCVHSMRVFKPTDAFWVRLFPVIDPSRNGVGMMVSHQPVTF